MLYLTPLPPELYEVINCALFTTSTVVLLLCIRYLLTAYVQLRNPAPGTHLGELGIPALTRLESLYELRKFRLAVGFTIFLLGESPRMGYLWLVRYLANAGHDVAWMSKGMIVTVPIIGSAIAVVGFACIARAIVPEVWGRYGYFGTLLLAGYAVVLTQVIRDPEELAHFSIASAVVMVLLTRYLPRVMRALRNV